MGGASGPEAEEDRGKRPWCSPRLAVCPERPLRWPLSIPPLDLSDKGHWFLREFHSAVGRAFRKLVCPVPAALEGPTGPLGSRSCGEEGRHGGARSAEPRAVILWTPV